MTAVLTTQSFFNVGERIRNLGGQRLAANAGNYVQIVTL